MKSPKKGSFDSILSSLNRESSDVYEGQLVSRDSLKVCNAEWSVHGLLLRKEDATKEGKMLVSFNTMNLFQELDHFLIVYLVPFLIFLKYTLPLS